MDDREAVEAVGEILKGCLNASGQWVAEDIERQVMSIIDATVVSPAESTQRYQARCDEFLERAIAVKGMPVRSITGDGTAKTVGLGLPKNATMPTEALYAQKMLCVERYRKQAQLYVSGEMENFRALLSEFLSEASNGKPATKELKRKVTAIKGALRDLAKWDRLFSTIKNSSFPSAINRTFAFEGDPLAAVWSYSQLDETGEFRNAYSHKELAERVYAVRDNWAIKKGHMKVGPDGYVEDAPVPGEDFDCMCRFRFIYNLGSLPESMLTPEGQSKLACAKAEVAKLLGKPS